MRRLSLLISLGLVYVACSSDPEEPAPQAECTPNQFRACSTELGIVGHQQCLQPGAWAPCIASVYDDASYADHGQPDAPGEASDAGDAETDVTRDAALDATDGGDGGDAAEASLLD